MIARSGQYVGFQLNTTATASDNSHRKLTAES
jgi:hypothetical protein